MKMMLALLVMVSFALPAAADVSADGAVFYKMPSGELVKREGTLAYTHDESGELNVERGKITLTFGETALEAKRVFVSHGHGHTKVYLLFVYEHETPTPKPEPNADFKVAFILGGSLLKGTNGAVYYGDVFSKKMKTAELEAFADNFQDCGLDCGGGCSGECGSKEGCEGGCAPKEGCEGGCKPGQAEKHKKHHHHHHHHHYKYTGGFYFVAKSPSK